MQVINPKNVWKPKNRGFNMGVIGNEGHILYFTGQVAWDENECIIGKGDIKQQTIQCFENIINVLKPVGGKIDDIISLTTYFTNRSQLPFIQEIRQQYFKKSYAPVSTSVMVAGLGHIDFLVELTPIAIIPFDRFIPAIEETIS